MHRFITAALKAFGAQLVGSKSQSTWTAYTARGKIVVIQGDRVIKVIDPKKTMTQPGKRKKW